MKPHLNYLDSQKTKKLPSYNAPIFSSSLGNIGIIAVRG